MDDAALNLRIRVITVSARAAVHSLGPTDPQVADVVARGRRLLDGLAPLVLEHGSDEVKLALARAREEFASVDGKG